MKSGMLLPLLLFAASAFSQDSTFQLKDYQYRTPGYQALALYFGLSGGYSHSNVPMGDESNSRSLSLGPVSAWYARVTSTDARVHQSTVSLTSAYSLSGSTYNGKKSSSHSLSPQVAWDWNDRFYRQHNWFIEVGNQFSLNSFSYRSNDTLWQSKNTNTGFQERLTLGFGKGRIERVQDAQMALFLLQDLAAEGLLSRAVTAGEAYQLAQLVTDINNRRVFDSRRRRKYELTRLDSFFRYSGLAPQTNIRHFAVLNDNWALAFNPSRLSGASWYLRFQPGVSYNRVTSSMQQAALFYQSKSSARQFSLMPVVGYENDKPISLQWQRNLGISIAYLRNRNKTELESTSQNNTVKSSNETKGWQSTAHAYYGLGYYPNNRTQVNGVLDLMGLYDEFQRFGLQSQFNLNVQYFIGYRTFLTAAANARHTLSPIVVNGKNEQTKNFTSDFSVSFSHLLF